jgi:hypothetical protein
LGTSDSATCMDDGNISNMINIALERRQKQKLFTRSQQYTRSIRCKLIREAYSISELYENIRRQGLTKVSVILNNACC